jgi:hypothetical protein
LLANVLGQEEQMAAPKVFVSSTCYDLKYIRENLSFFIRSIGYEPILSEEGSVFYNPRVHTGQACLTEIPNCQMLILIVGGRYDSTFPKSETSITNGEYREAVRNKIPIFALVEQGVHNEYHVYSNNVRNPMIAAEKIRYPSVDDTRIFRFFTEVRSNAINNAIVPFRDFADIENYLEQQWAGMMFSFLLGMNEDARVADTLEILSSVNERIEMLSRQILKSVGTDEAKLTAELYDRLLSSEAVRDLSWINCRPTPAAVLDSANYADCASNLGRPLRVTDKEEFALTSDGEISISRFDRNSQRFLKLKEEMRQILAEYGVPEEQFLRHNRSDSRREPLMAGYALLNAHKAGRREKAPQEGHRSGRGKSGGKSG